MPDLQKEMAELREHLRPVAWTDKRNDEVLRRIEGRRRRFTISTVALGSAVLAMAASIVIIWFAQGRTTQQLSVRDTQPEVYVSSKSALKGIELGDGSRAVGPGSGALILVSETDSQVSFTLESGKAWFDVKPSDERRVEVVVDDVRVNVSGTEFVVEVVGDFVHVWVHRGEAEVHSPEGVDSLGEGEERRFPSKNSAEESPKRVRILTDTKRSTREKIPSSERSRTDKSRLNKGKSHDSDVLDTHPPSKVEPKMSSDTVEETLGKPEIDDSASDKRVQSRTQSPVSTVASLWDRADKARRQGKDKEAAKALATLVNEHANDPRAALAAFTLGRVLVNSNRQHSTAARAFAKARKLSPGGPLAEDALFREIEAWYAAKDMRRVKSRSSKYVRLFPTGRYRRQIKELLERQN